MRKILSLKPIGQFSLSSKISIIRKCLPSEFRQIFEIIDDSSKCYRGVIPDVLWPDHTKPFASEEYLNNEINVKGVEFWGYEINGLLCAVMGIQNFSDVTLIRHAYVLTEFRGKGIGSELVEFNKKNNVEKPILVGCLKAMTWAISFYQKHGFRVVSDEERNILRARCWTLSKKHVNNSVVLVDSKWHH